MKITKHPEAKIWKIVNALNGKKYYKREILTNEGISFYVGNNGLRRVLDMEYLNTNIEKFAGEIEFFVPTKELLTLSDRDLAKLIFSYHDEDEEWYAQFNFN